MGLKYKDLLTSVHRNLHNFFNKKGRERAIFHCVSLGLKLKCFVQATTLIFHLIVNMCWNIFPCYICFTQCLLSVNLSLLYFQTFSVMYALKTFFYTLCHEEFVIYESWLLLEW